MTSVHTVRPTDLAALVAYNGRVYPNEAVTRDRIGTQISPHPLETALEQWFSFATGRHTWISVKGATLRGLASARKRGSNAAWEVDCLIDADTDEAGVLLSLLDQMASDAGRAGAEKVFLRVAAQSPMVQVASRCGFVPYLREHLLAVEGTVDKASASPTGGAALRRWGRADAYPTFRLYNRCTPELVRRQEAVTFREWNAVRERISPQRGARQWVLERQDRIDGWLRIAAAGELGRFDLMADPDQPDLLDPLIDSAIRRLSEQSALIALVPEFAVELLSRLEKRGFFDRGEFVVLVRRTARPVEAPQPATAVPVHSFPA